MNDKFLKFTTGSAALLCVALIGGCTADVLNGPSESVSTVTSTAAQDGSTAFETALSTVCPTEDSDNCYWNASVSGNGQGMSFVSVNGTVYNLGESVVTTVEVPVEVVVEKIVEVPGPVQYVTKTVEVAGPTVTEYVTDQGAIDRAYAEGSAKADAAYDRGFEAGASTVAGR